MKKSMYKVHKLHRTSIIDKPLTCAIICFHLGIALYIVAKYLLLPDWVGCIIGVILGIGAISFGLTKSL